MKKKLKRIAGIDPGQQGAIVVIDEGDTFEWHPLPYKEKEIDFDALTKLVSSLGADNIFLERAMAMAMGSSHAFNYGRAFMALEIAVRQSGVPVVYVEPQKWSKVMHQGISNDLKPKAKSLIAVERLCPKIYPKIPANRNGKLHDGVVDALLIANYGLRFLNANI